VSESFVVVGDVGEFDVLGDCLAISCSRCGAKVGAACHHPTSGYKPPCRERESAHELLDACDTLRRVAGTRSAAVGITPHEKHVIRELALWAERRVRLWGA